MVLSGVFHSLPPCLSVTITFEIKKFFFTSSIADINTIVKIADAFVLSLSIPNLIGVFMMSNIIKNEIEVYIYKLHNNKFKNT